MNEIRTVAVDLDGTLADIHTPAIKRSEMLDAYSPDSFTESDWKEYKHRSQNVWHNHNDEVPLVEECVPAVMAELNEHHEVIILTHRRNVNEQISEWLARHDIAHDKLMATHRDKAEFEMDAYVDDNPIGSSEACVFLRSQPWNAEVESGYDERITTLANLPVPITS